MQSRATEGKIQQRNQWKLKEQRRCKECIAEIRGLAKLEVPNDYASLLSLSEAPNRNLSDLYCRCYDVSVSIVLNWLGFGVLAIIFELLWSGANFGTNTSPQVAAAFVVVATDYYINYRRECKVKRAKELRDPALFKQPPPREDCPICFLPLPLDDAEAKYQPCCGKNVCMGCIYGMHGGNNEDICPFCRAPEEFSDREHVERYWRREEAGDAEAINILGYFYRDGEYGLSQDYERAIGLWLRAGELGHATAYNNIGCAYNKGEGVEMDTKKAAHYFELGAMGGDVVARYNVGIEEENAGNMNRAMKHYMISASAGCDISLKKIRECYISEHATKDDFEKALRAHKEAKDEMKSDRREAAKADVKFQEGFESDC